MSRNILCPRCIERGKTWNGGDPVCAFKDGHKFDTDNWNCATMNDLRSLCDQEADHPNYTYNEDEYLGVIPIEDLGDFAILSWYKMRGRTYGFWIVSEGEVRLGTLSDARTILKEEQEQ